MCINNDLKAIVPKRNIGGGHACAMFRGHGPANERPGHFSQPTFMQVPASRDDIS